MAVDVIIVFAFGAFKEQDCFNSPNWHIANQAKYFAKKLMVPIVTQKDVPVNTEGLEVFFVEEGSGYLSTLGVVKKAVELAKKKGWRRAGVIAAPPHERRCRRDLRRLRFFKEVEGKGNDYFRFIYSSGFWFSKKSTQLWTRSSVRWWLREIPLRLMPWWLYKRIAGNCQNIFLVYGAGLRFCLFLFPIFIFKAPKAFRKYKIWRSIAIERSNRLERI